MYTPSPHHEHEERERVEERRRAREERRERVTPPTDWDAWAKWHADNCRRAEEILATLDPHHDHAHLVTLLGVHGHWEGPVADAAKAFLRQLLADVEERDREAREELEAISQEKFNGPDRT